MHYLVTGHTGFKGSWLVLLLRARGHRVSGMALDPVSGGLYEQARLAEVVEHDHRVDIRDQAAVARSMAEIAPDVVVHLAAQALVRESYARPRETLETNVWGTLNVTEAVAATPGVRAYVVVTTDKVYRNIHQIAGYVEGDALGGDDPYSVSKAMADLMTQAWIHRFPGVPTAIARAGNVIGGGDVSTDRLLPDLIDAAEQGRAPSLRYPQAVRPWQHVLDCLNGYLVLVDALLAGKGEGAWNFGPGPESFITVGEISHLVADIWGATQTWRTVSVSQPHEAELLALDASHAERELGWSNRLGFRETVEWTVEWERLRRLENRDSRELTEDQILRFETR
jgi:CDP-glucose 4,6-dehydratase